MEISGSTRVTLFIDKAESQRLVITNLSECVVYVTASFSDVLVWGCVDTEVVLVDVGRVVTVSHCERVTVRAVCEILHAETSTESRLFLLSKRSPVISGDSRSIVLGPFNVFLHALPSRFKTVDAANFAHPVCAALVEDPYSLVAPDKFKLTVIPILRGLLAPPLPQVYAEAIDEQKKRVSAMKDDLHAIADEGAKRQVLTILQGHFREWLTTGGASIHRQLLDLSKIN
jgi:hypothetical protein